MEIWRISKLGCLTEGEKTSTTRSTVNARCWSPKELVLCIDKQVRYNRRFMIFDLPMLFQTEMFWKCIDHYYTISTIIIRFFEHIDHWPFALQKIMFAMNTSNTIQKQKWMGTALEFLKRYATQGNGDYHSRWNMDLLWDTCNELTVTGIAAYWSPETQESKGISFFKKNHVLRILRLLRNFLGGTGWNEAQ